MLLQNQHAVYHKERHHSMEGNLENVETMFDDIQKESQKVKSFISQPNWIQTAMNESDNNKVKQSC